MSHSANSGMPPPHPANTLEQMLAKKQQLEEDLRSLERLIFDSEESYLEDTNHYGNVVKGWDGFLTSRPKPASHHASKRNSIATKERIFSISSTSAPIQEGMEEGAGEEGDMGAGSQGGKEMRRSRMAKIDEGEMSD